MPALFPRFGTAPLSLSALCLAAVLSGCGASTSDTTADTQQPRPKPIAAAGISRWSPSLALSMVPSAAANLPDGRVRLWASDDGQVSARQGRGTALDFDPADFTMTQREVAVDRDEACVEIPPIARSRPAPMPAKSHARCRGTILSIDDAQVIDVDAGLPSRGLASMPLVGRVQDALMLPSGEVLVIAGSPSGGELWSPATQRFTKLPAFDGLADGAGLDLLLPDARVLTIRTPELRIFTPHYLLNADGSPAHRPVITAAPASATHGTRIDVATDSAVDQFVLVRTPAASRPLDHEQRRISLSFTRIDDGDYSLGLPADPGVLLPGNYLLFAIDAAGVPSVAAAIRIGTEAAPVLLNPGPQVSRAFAPVMLTAHAATPAGSLSFAADGLPPGLAIDPATGTISGTPSKEGQYTVTLSASNGTATTAALLDWSIEDVAARASWVRLETRSALNDELPVAIDSFDLLGRDGAPILRDGRRVSAGANAARVIRTHALLRAADADPRGLTVELGARQAIGGFRVAASTSSAALATWRFFTSDDGSRWTLAAAGHFKPAGAAPADRTVMLNRAPSLAPVSDLNTRVGEPVTLAVSANDPDGDPLHFSADGLPRGLAMNPATGVISGIPNETGKTSVTLHVSDGDNPPVDGSFAWQVSASPMVIEPVLATPQAAGSSVGFTLRSNRAAARYRWRFGDGSPEVPVGSATMVSHVFATPGLYTVTVSAIDASGERGRLAFTQAIYRAGGASPRAVAATSVPHPTGAYLFTVPAAAHFVSIVDPVRHVEIHRFDTGQAIDRLGVSADGLRLYAHHPIDRTVGVFDLSRLVNYGELDVRPMAAVNR